LEGLFFSSGGSATFFFISFYYILSKLAFKCAYIAFLSTFSLSSQLNEIKPNKEKPTTEPTTLFELC